MSAIEYATQVVLASLGSAGVLYAIGRFLLRNVIEKRIDHYFSERLEATRAEYAAALAGLTSDLKLKADLRLESEKKRYTEELENLRASLQYTASRDLEGIRSNYAIAQETKKAELTIEAQDTLELFRLRRSMYPGFVELMYRIRNKARDSLTRTDLTRAARELDDLIVQLVDKMYEFRVYLDHDHVHLRVHAFKNTSQAFLKILELYAKSQTDNNHPDTSAQTLHAELEALFERILQQESSATTALQDLVSAHHATNPAA